MTAVIVRADMRPLGLLVSPDLGDDLALAIILRAADHVAPLGYVIVKRAGARQPFTQRVVGHEARIIGHGFNHLTGWA